MTKLKFLIVLVSGLFLSGCTSSTPKIMDTQINPSITITTNPSPQPTGSSTSIDNSNSDESELLKLLESDSLPDLDAQIKELEVELQ